MQKTAVSRKAGSDLSEQGYFIVEAFVSGPGAMVLRDLVACHLSRLCKNLRALAGPAADNNPKDVNAALLIRM
jgi:hypothetical protein